MSTKLSLAAASSCSCTLVVIPEGDLRLSLLLFVLSQPKTKLRHLDRSAAQWRDPRIGLCICIGIGIGIWHLHLLLLLPLPLHLPLR